MNDENNQPSIMATIESIRFVGWLVMRGYSSLLYAFTRHRFGPKYFGLVELGGLLIPILFVMTVILVIPPQLSFLPLLANAYLFLMIWHRVQGVSRSKRILMHSRYNGYPRLCYILPFSEETVKAKIEPMCVTLSGFGLLALDPIFGLFLMVGGFVMGFDHEAITRHTADTTTRVVDAEIEDDVLNEELDRRYRRRRNE